MGVGLRGPVDVAAQRRRNAEAPRIPHLGRRVLALFRPYRRRVFATILLVILGAVLGVVPPLVIQRVFDEALFPDSGPVQLGLLGALIGFMIGLYVAAAVTQVAQMVGKRESSSSMVSGSMGTRRRSSPSAP